jgi:hypothetical protein
MTFSDDALCLMLSRYWWVSGAEHTLWVESHVFQHERKLPVHRHALSTQLPVGPCGRVCLPFSSQTCFWKSFISLLDQPKSSLHAYLTHRKSVTWRLTVCFFFSKWGGNEIIQQQPLQPKSSLVIAKASWSSLPSTESPCNTKGSTSAVSILWDDKIYLSLRFSSFHLCSWPVEHSKSYLFYCYDDLPHWGNREEQGWVSILPTHGVLL